MRVVRHALLASFLVTAPVVLHAQQPAASRTIASQTAGMERHDGFIPFYYDEHTGKLLLEVQRLDQDFLYLPTLATGLGSNDLGLDRGTTGNEAVVRFERFGPRVFAREPKHALSWNSRLTAGPRRRGILRDVHARRDAHHGGGGWTVAGGRD